MIQKDVSDLDKLDLSLGAKLLTQEDLKLKAPNLCILSDSENKHLNLLKKQSFH